MEIISVLFMEGFRLTIFLTGSTGFLGGKLLTNLLETTDHTLFVLVRDMDKAERLVTSLSGNAADRIKLLNGDITQPLLGLSDNVIQDLTGKVDLFYHIAALVKFDEELREELFAVNYGGTRKRAGTSKAIQSETIHLYQHGLHSRETCAWRRITLPNRCKHS